VPLTPAEIHNMEFRKASLGKRGYDDEQVDAFLDEATREMIRLLEDNDLLQRRLDAADAATDRAPAARSAGELEFAAVTADLDRARRECERAVRDARLARQRLDEARRLAATDAAATADEPGAQQVLSMAERTADDYLHQADEQSASLVTEARERAERLVEDARTLVGDIERNVRRRQDEAAADLATQRAAALRQIEELTQFIEQYRAALEGHLVRQGQLVDGSAAPPEEQNPS